MDDQLKAEILGTLDLEADRSIGQIFEVEHDKIEILPIKFGEVKYLMAFVHPKYEAAANDDNLFESICDEWAEGFRPLDSSRIIKYFREDAEDDHLNPDKWKIKEPRLIFDFFDLIAKSVVYYAQANEEVKQFIYWPANDSLNKVYKRIFRKINSEFFDDSFVDISANLGVFNGYQRS